MTDTNDQPSEHQIEQWAGIVGFWRLEDNLATYAGPERPEWPYGICVSGIRFSDGEARATIRQSNPNGTVDGRILLGYHSQETDYYIVGLGGYGRAYSLSHWHPITGWRPLATSGAEQNLVAQQSYNILVRVRGQQVVLEVDGVRVLEHALSAPLPNGQIGLFLWNSQPGVVFSDVVVRPTQTRRELVAASTLPITSNELGRRSPADHLVVLVHGINTRALWMGEVRPTLERAGFYVAPTSYGRYGVLQFLLPFGLLRNGAIDRVVSDIKTARRSFQRQYGVEPKSMSTISHSFGTYVVSRIIAQNPEFHWDRIIFCGSVVREDFPFDQVLDRFNPPLLNEIGTRDYLPALAESAGWGHGSVGSTGFNRPPVETRWHSGLKHSDFLTEGFCTKFWVPFLQGQKAEQGSRPTALPLWIRAITWLPLRWPILAVLSAAVLLLVFWIWRPQPEIPLAPPLSSLEGTWVSKDGGGSIVFTKSSDGKLGDAVFSTLGRGVVRESWGTFGSNIEFNAENTTCYYRLVQASETTITLYRRGGNNPACPPLITYSKLPQ